VNFSKKSIILSIAAIVSLSFIGCGHGSNSSTNSGTTTKTGVFTDSPVTGLYYKTSSGITGYTKQKGLFKYKPGDMISFYLHNLKLGQTKASSLITPSSISMYHSGAIAYILQNLDTDGNISNGIQLPNPKLLNKISFNDINLSNPNLSNNDFSTINNKINLIQSQSTDKNYTFTKIALECAEQNYYVSTIYNYFNLMKNTKKSFLLMPNGGNGSLLTFNAGKIYDDNQSIGRYDVNQSILPKNMPICTTTPTNVNIVSSSSNDTSATFMALVKIQFNNNNSINISNITQAGNFWFLSNDNSLLIQTETLKDAILLQISLNESFESVKPSEFYLAKLSSNKIENGKIRFNTDNNVSITLDNNNTKATIDGNGDIVSNKQSIILDPTNAFMDIYNDTLIIPTDNNVYIISATQSGINSSISSMRNNKNYFQQISQYYYSLIDLGTIGSQYF